MTANLACYKKHYAPIFNPLVKGGHSSNLNERSHNPLQSHVLVPELVAHECPKLASIFV